MKTFLCYTALLLGVAVQPVAAQLTGHPGEAVLSTGITIRGDLCYQPDANSLLISTGDKWRSYMASQLQSFHFTELATGHPHRFTVFDIPQKGQDAVSVILEELTPGVPIHLVRLMGNRANTRGKQYGLPQTRNGKWQSLQPWYVVMNGRFVAPDDFVENVLDGVVERSPESVQQWAEGRPRPGNLSMLNRWLSSYYGKMTAANANTEPVLVTEQYTNL